MVRLVDVPLDNGDSKRAVADLQDSIKSRSEGNQETRQQTAVEKTVHTQSITDPRFAGKSAAEIVDMYKNLESHSGRLASQIGENRRLLDSYILGKRENDLRQGSGQEPVKVKPEDLMINPTETLDRYMQSRSVPQVSALQERINQLEAQLNNTAFQMRHPKADEMTADPAFAEWVKQTPMRMRAAQAAASGNTQEADLLLTEWNTALATGSATANQTRDRAQELAKRVVLESNNTSNESGTGGNVKAKTLRRRDLIALRQNDPERYDAMGDEITRAYMEKRVVD